MFEDQNNSNPNEWEKPIPDVEERLVGDFLAMYPAIEEFVNTAYEWEDERVNNPEIMNEKLSHKGISIIVFLAESLKERISKLMSDLPNPSSYDQDDMNATGYL